MIARALPATVLLVAALGLSGCSASSGGSASDASADRAPDVAVAPGNGAVGSAADAGGAAAGEVDPSADRQVITTGSATITVDEPTDAADDTARIVESAGGRVDARTLEAATDSGPGSATLTVRIPSDRLTATLDAIEELGDVEQVSLSDSDVTESVQDLDARIAASRTSVDRLLALLAAADSTKDLITIEDALQQRQSDLESMEAQQRYYADQVAMATVQVDLIAVEDAPVDAPTTFLDGLSSGWAAFVAFLAGALVVVGALLPWLAFLGIVAGAVLAMLRWRRRRGGSGAGVGQTANDEPAADAADDLPGTTIRR